MSYSPNCQNNRNNCNNCCKNCCNPCTPCNPCRPCPPPPVPPQPEPPYPPYPPFPPEPPVPPTPLAPTVTVGTTFTGAPGTSAVVTNSGTPQNAVLNFVIPRGETGAVGATGLPGTPATVTVGTTTTGAPGTNATVTNSGTPQNAVLNFVIPRGETGAVGATGLPGTPATVTVGTTTTGAPGTNAVVTNSGTANNAVLNFTVPAGETGTANLSYGIFTAQPYTTANNNSPMIFTGTGSSADIALNNTGTAVNLAAGGVYDVSYIITGTAANNMTITPHHNNTPYTLAEQTVASPTGTTASTISASGSYIVNAANTALLLEIYVSSETEPISNLTGILSIKKIA